ncbi:MAG: Exopolysaccharide biosynthesis polyprenyl glycosylphosphotransferase [Parcubacteria group bacterium GW2011_GWC1_45_9]|nr:MAG: Exopolysaccharide biosynthesis polyprenyl glycosylphosphotransferase [Parcubacteria group bacterium GW2011_GWB1_45_10]KKU16783.1 MAG: Exopolysaccharide biosynthesis polyprenyl glycosylphosphotransferase [Parcubacteria group bacterium GW2011_GWC1_45_9]HCI05440.1 sugar transferase [Patescibacteria group bacterium]
MFKKLVNLLSDSLCFWLSFFLVYLIQWHEFSLAWQVFAFALVFCLGLLIFFSMGLYEERKTDWLFPGLTALVIFFFASVVFFYFFSRFYPNVTPRGSLILFFGFFSALFIASRMILEGLIIKKLSEKIMVLVKNPGGRFSEKLGQESKNFGFEILELEEEFAKDLSLFEKTVKEEKIKIIVLDLPPKSGLSLGQKFYKKAAALKIEIFKPETFFEKRLKKIYLEEFDLSLLNQIEEKSFKNPSQRLTALFLMIVGLPVWLLIFVLMKLFSPGPIFFKQRRVGLNGSSFEAYKFRTMVFDAEKDGPKWSEPNDPRITPLGKIIRQNHLDELPQLINIFKGEMFFVGPRPERPEFVKKLEEEIPLYSLRHLIKPGLTGWAQINYPYGASIKDAENKLEYDLYYLKHRSLALDLVILIKTFKFLFFNFSR